MRVSKTELIVVGLLVVVLGVAYQYVTPLLQGVTAEEDWTYWVMYASTYTKVKDVIPVETVAAALMAVAAIYILCFKRKAIWQWLVSHSIPSWLSQTSIAIIVEKYLTDNYALQRKALKYIPTGTKTVVDVGCGGAAYLSKLCNVRKIGLDASPKRLRVARHYCDETVLRDITVGLEDIEADTALCFEVIEHLTEEQGDKLLRDLEKFPTVILTTPREFFEVRRDGYERHQSFWPAENLAQYGYEQVDRGRIPPSDIYVRGSQ